MRSTHASIAGVVVGDDPDSVEISFRQEKVATRREEGTTIAVTPL